MSRKDPDFFCFHHRGPSFFIFMNLCYFDTSDYVHLHSDEKETLGKMQPTFAVQLRNANRHGGGGAPKHFAFGVRLNLNEDKRPEHVLN